MNALGRQLLLELKDCDKELLNDTKFLIDLLCDTAVKIGATIVNHTYHKFSPQGVSCVVLIAESHICIHTWPEYNYASADIFTCGCTIDPKDAIPLLVKGLHAKESSSMELKRGILQANNVICGIK